LILPRVYPILDTGAIEERGLDPLAVLEAWLAAGVEIVQFRHTAFWSRAVYEMAREIGRRCARAGIPLIVNDRADFAALLGAGLHIGQDDLSPSDARRVVGPGALLGYSTHNADQLATAAREPVAYVALGPIFSTASKVKPGPLLGPQSVRNWRHLASQPLAAIGGITRETAPSVWEAGADSVAVISDLLPEEGASARLRERMEQWLQLGKL
jgi:thiamine-phosphate pyrophosphorylase